jgi:hypothetical protein
LKHLIAFGVLAAAAAGSAQAAELFNNGTIINQAPNLSVLTAPPTTLGAGSNSGATLADNFTVTGAGWNVQSLDFFGYQTGSTSFTFTGVTWSILSGSNIATATTVASGTTAVTSLGIFAYRVTDTTLTATNRPVYRMNADIPDITLAAGSYFVTWALAGTGASGPFVPPVPSTLGTGNALQALTGGAYTPLIDAGSGQTFDVPFVVNGTLVPVPEPTTYAMLLAGGLAVVGLARRRRAAV